MRWLWILEPEDPLPLQQQWLIGPIALSEQKAIFAQHTLSGVSSSFHETDWRYHITLHRVSSVALTIGA
jgi:hypothetical protein